MTEKEWHGVKHFEEWPAEERVTVPEGTRHVMDDGCVWTMGRRDEHNFQPIHVEETEGLDG